MRQSDLSWRLKDLFSLDEFNFNKLELGICKIKFDIWLEAELGKKVDEVDLLTKKLVRRVSWHYFEQFKIAYPPQAVKAAYRSTKNLAVVNIWQNVDDLEEELGVLGSSFEKDLAEILIQAYLTLK